MKGSLTFKLDGEPAICIKGEIKPIKLDSGTGSACGYFKSASDSPIVFESALDFTPYGQIFFGGPLDQERN